MESVYNTHGFNNEHAIGFDNIEARVAADTAAGNFEAAHENVFDKLLADYFLAKRGEYKESNKLMGELQEIFEQKDFAKEHALDITQLRQHRDKTDEVDIQPENMRHFLQLDLAVARVMQDDRNGLSEAVRSLRHGDVEHPEYHTTQIPDYFHMFDVRKPANKYVEDKLAVMVKELFEIRLELEKSMSRSELIAFDKVFAKHLQYERLYPRLVDAINADYGCIDRGGAASHMERESRKDIETQLMKVDNTQREFNKNIKNEDALFKLLAFNGARERAAEELDADRRASTSQRWDYNSWEEYYRENLRHDAQKPARAVNPADFVQRKPWEYTPADAEFKNREEREAEYVAQHSLYLENKKEQQERIKMFYVLEQMYEETRANPNPSSKAHAAIKNYFAEPENTFFFDKNKII